jgi:hypothetical protein
MARSSQSSRISASGALVELALSAICRHSFARLVGHSDVGLTPTADLNCVHVSERTRREMGTGGNIESAACSWRELAGVVAALLYGERLAQKLHFAG